MAAPQVSGAVALLMQRHPDWTVAQIKSALVQTGDPVRDARGHEVSVLREGGGLVDLVKADNPLFFASPSSISFPTNGGTVHVGLTDAGGGNGELVGLHPAPAPLPGRDGRRLEQRHGPRPADRDGKRLARGAERRRHRVRRPHARRPDEADPVLGRGEPPPASDRAREATYGTRYLSGDDRRRREQGGPLPLPDQGRRLLSGPRGRLSRPRLEADRELRRRRPLGLGDPACRVRRRREPPHRVHGASDRPQPVPGDVRRGAACRRSRSARARELRDRLRHALRRSRQGRSRSATGSTTRRRRSCMSSRRAAGRSSSRSPTAEPGSIRSRCGQPSTAAASSSTTATTGSPCPRAAAVTC